MARTPWVHYICSLRWKASRSTQTDGMTEESQLAYQSRPTCHVQKLQLYQNTTSFPSKISWSLSLVPAISMQADYLGEKVCSLQRQVS